MGGTNEADNLVYLSAEDHIRAHLLLGATYGGKQWVAIQYLMGNHTKYGHVPTKLMVKNAAFAKMKHAEFNIGETAIRFGSKASAETCAKLCASWTDDRKEHHKSIYADPEWREEHKTVFSNARKRMLENNPMHKAENRAKISGKNNPWYGKKHSSETRVKMSGSHSGEKHHMYGKKHSEASKLQMSKSAMGRKLSQSAKDKISGINSVSAVKVKCVNTGEVFVSIREAAKKFGLNQKSLWHCTRRETPMTNGLNFVRV